MSLNNIALKPMILTQLYADTLVETSVAGVPEKTSVRWLGSNQKNIIVIVRHEDVPVLPDEALNFLATILSACKLGLLDIALVNAASTNETALQTLIAEEGKTVLLFGTDPLSIGLPINFPPFQLQQFNQRTYLYCPSLREIEKDKTLKSKLWTSLKTLFGI
jgi:hypothetical protein